MADLLGSLLPGGYMAPDVQNVLGGMLLLASCSPSGEGPVESCVTGSSPDAECSAGNSPRSEQGSPPPVCSSPGSMCFPTGFAP